MRQYSIGTISYFPADKNKDTYANENEINSAWSVDNNPSRYCAEYFDKETGTIYLRARYYNLYTGRFITEDSVWGEANDPLILNLYTYCTNNPITFNDPTGHMNYLTQSHLLFGGYATRPGYFRNKFSK